MLRYSNAKINQSQSNNQTYSEEVSDDGIKTLTLTLSYGPYSLYNKSYQHHNINTYTAATAQQQHARFHFLSPSAQISNLKFSMLLFITVVTNELHTNKSKLKTSLSQLNFYISSYFELNTLNLCQILKKIAMYRKIDQNSFKMPNFSFCYSIESILFSFLKNKKPCTHGLMDTVQYFRSAHLVSCLFSISFL